MTASKEDRSTILFAASADSVQRLSKGLSDEYEIVSCASMELAQAALAANRVDLIVCESHFDNCRMFDLLRYCKLTETIRDIPFLAIRLDGGELDDTAYEAVEIASKALGAVAFVDFFRLGKSLSRDEFDERFRLCLRFNTTGGMPD